MDGSPGESRSSPAQPVHDVADAHVWDAVASATLGEFGPADILVNNAGILAIGGVLDTGPDDVDRVVAVNQRRCLLGMRAVALQNDRTRQRVDRQHVAGRRPGRQRRPPAYTATKFAIRGMTKAAAVDLAPRGIRVNSVHPGLVRTPMTEAPGTTGRRPGLLESIPNGRAGTVADVTAMVLFLASDDSSYSTGSEFVLDGGALAGRAARPAATDRG